MSASAKNIISLVAHYSSDLSGFAFTQKSYWNLVSFILGESFNYWATAEQWYQQQLFLRLCFKIKRVKHCEFHGKKIRKADHNEQGGSAACKETCPCWLARSHTIGQQQSRELNLTCLLTQCHFCCIFWAPSIEVKLSNSRLPSLTYKFASQSA